MGGPHKRRGSNAVDDLFTELKNRGINDVLITRAVPGVGRVHPIPRILG